jgi:hypothetical protein
MTPCPRLWQAFAERAGEAEFGAQPLRVDRSVATRGGDPRLVFELAQQALQPERLRRAALGGIRRGVPRRTEVQHGDGLIQPDFLPPLGR